MKIENQTRVNELKFNYLIFCSSSTGQGDKVKCFKCNIEISEWDVHSARPKYRHAAQSPECPFLKTLCCPAFIKLHREKYMAMNRASIFESRRKNCVRPKKSVRFATEAEVRRGAQRFL